MAAIHEEFDEAKKLATTEKKLSGRIEKIVLYGSHARGDWVEDRANGFMSDYDLLIIVNQIKLTDSTAPWRERVEDRFLREDLRREADGSMRPPVSIIVHTMHEMNTNLALGRYFFCDVFEEGILLYERKGSKPFAKPGPVDAEAALAEAKEAFELWFGKAESALKGAKFYLEEEEWRDSSFLFHQTVERLYTCVSLVFTLYSPATHNIGKLRSRCEQYDARLIEVWPRSTRKENSYFNKLKEAYVKSRYAKHWEISAEELDWLSARVKHLQAVVKTVCEDKLG